LSGFEGISVVEAGDGGTALRMLHQRRFDLMVTDLFLPVLDGMQVLMMMRTQGLNRETPVIMMTADNRPMTRTGALQRGAHEVLVKPFPCEALIAATRRALGMPTDASPGSDQRRAARLRIPVEIAIPGDTVLICNTWDISPYGAFVTCESPPLSTRVTLSLMLRSGPVEVPAEIVHTRPYPSGPLPAGFGCKFIENPEVMRRLLAAFVSPDDDD
ncbi:MAG: response regulator, partial [Myxococcota bacterium]